MWKVVPSWLGAASTINWWHQVPQKIPMPRKCGAVPTLWKCGKGSYAVEARRVVPSWLAASNTVKDPTPWKPGGLYYVGWVLQEPEKIPMSWKCGEVPTLWKCGRLY